MQSPFTENVTSIANESPAPVEVTPESTPAETGGSALKGEIGAEKFVSPQPQVKKDDDITPPQNTPAPPKKPGNIVDKTAGVTKTKPVDPKADSLTTLADKDEEEFIVGVEAAHNGH